VELPDDVIMHVKLHVVGFVKARMLNIGKCANFALEICFIKSIQIILGWQNFFNLGGGFIR